MINLELTHQEMEGLQSLCSTADLTRIKEDSMPGVASLMAKVYQWESGGWHYVERKEHDVP